jgi:capsular exopolysaccharide synthesis family protein
VSPKTPIYLLVGMLAGAVVGVGVAALRAALDQSIKTPEALAAVTEAPLLSVIPRERRPGAGPRNGISTSPISETIRQLRTSVQFVNVGRPLTCVLFTSAMAGEGKSFVSANFAKALSEAGTRTVLVDADLRRPSQALSLGIDPTRGLTGVLLNRFSLDDALQPVGSADLQVLSSGPLPPNPSELLGSPSMVSLLRSLRERFDMVVIDSPPVLPVTDAAILGHQADGVVLVVGSDVVKRGQLQRAEALLRGVNVELVGVVLNKVRSGSAGATPYYYAERPERPSIRAQGEALVNSGAATYH